jgi:hypothetical protein
VNATGYIINSILVLLVLRQVRETKLGLASLVLPVVAVGVSAAYYLRSVPTAGNDLTFDLVLAAIGVTLGALCAIATRLRRGDDGVVLARAGVIAAALWIIGIGARIGFTLWSSHGGGPAIERFSVAHSITSPSAWVAAIVLMALSEVLARTAVLQVRARRLPAAVVAGIAAPIAGSARQPREEVASG